jgi:hypothetical protein
LVNESAVLVKLFVDVRHGNFLTVYLGADDTKNPPPTARVPIVGAHDQPL